MNESKLQANIGALREFVQINGWIIADEKEIQSGYRLIITDGITRTPIALFHSGKILIQGKPGELQTKLRLIALGVRDSKLLTDNRMLVMAEEIKSLCPHFVVPIEPKRYNELYDKVQNLNRLLAWGHAWTLENMLEKVPCDLAVVDKFGDESYVRKVLQEKGRQITVVQQTRAEEDTAVAAASILARARFVRQMEQLSKKVGKTLPKGASDPSIVVIGRELVAEHGIDILNDTAKLHFKTTEAILQS